MSIKMITTPIICPDNLILSEQYNPNAMKEIATLLIDGWIVREKIICSTSQVCTILWILEK